MILFADDTNILVIEDNKGDFQDSIKQTLQTVNTWFVNNRLSLNINKTQLVEFKSSSYVNDTFQSTDDIPDINLTTETRFLGITLDSTLSWKLHIEQVVAKMSSACYVLRNIKQVVSQDTLRMVYFANIHSLLSYGIILWGNSAYTKKSIFNTEKKYQNSNKCKTKGLIQTAVYKIECNDSVLSVHLFLNFAYSLQHAFIYSKWRNP